MEPRSPESLLRRQWILWVSLFAFPLMALPVCVLAFKVNEVRAADLPTVSAVCGALCLGAIALSFALPARLRRQPSTSPEQAVMASFIVANALGEGAGLAISVGYGVTRFSPLLVGLLASSLAMLAHRPSLEKNREWLREAGRPAR
jgi:hypothetical protein